MLGSALAKAPSKSLRLGDLVPGWKLSAVKFTETPLPGAYLIDLERKADDRGFFARLFCANEFEAEGLQTRFVQVNNSLSEERGTLRGLHYQLGPAAETKLVRCVQGAIWDCILDLRQNSSTFGQWFGAELSAQNRSMMYVPKGFAHGFLSLTEVSELVYFVDEYYSPSMERGVRWDDPLFGIKWPSQPAVLSQRDLDHPLFNPSHHLSLTGESNS